MCTMVAAVRTTLNPKTPSHGGGGGGGGGGRGGGGGSGKAEGELKIRRGLLCYRPTPTMLSQLLAGLNQGRSLLGI